MKTKKLSIRTVIGLILMLCSLIGIFIINLPTMKEDVLRFDSVYEGRTTNLEASYYEVSGAGYAALICPGFSCDRQKLRTIADQFVSAGITTMTFDYSGQGASDGVIGFNNAKTNHIPTEIHDALVLLHERSGIPYDHIILAGHSMGGRSILKLFTLDFYREPVGAAMLIAPEVDYVFSLQSSIFAGTTDAEEAPWDTYNGQYTAGTDIYLISSTFDDTVSHKSTIELFKRLGGETDKSRGTVTPMISTINEYGSNISLCVVPGALHSYQMYAPQIKSVLNQAITDFTGIPTHYSPWAAYLLYLLWFIGFAGAYLILGELTPAATVSAGEIPVLDDFGTFIRRKALLWIPALLVMFLICCISVVMPFGSPVLNIIFMGSIAGYGAVLLLAYRKGRFRGTHGHLPKPTLKIRRDGLLVTLSVLVCMVIYMVYAVRTGLYRVMPFNFRTLFWILAGGAMTIGYYVSGAETDMLAAAGVSRGKRLLYQLIQYVPILLYTVSYIALGSFSGLVEQMQNLMFMYVFALPLGRFFRIRTGNRLFGAAVTAFVFQAMMLMSTALIAVF
ncbi:MAG: alpha/beta hydrolase [Clostridia bacterium]|nr:alpha/beta hydrolase [Clostridia bacterium]